MSSFLFDGELVPLQPGDTILQAAHRAGHETFRICAGIRIFSAQRLLPGLHRVKVDGRPVAACTVHAAAGRAAGAERHRRAAGPPQDTCCRCCLSRATTFAQAARKAAIASCRPQAYARRHGGACISKTFYPRATTGSTPATPISCSSFDRCILCELCVRASRRCRWQTRVRDRWPWHRHPPAGEQPQGGRLADSARWPWATVRPRCVPVGA